MKLEDEVDVPLVNESLLKSHDVVQRRRREGQTFHLLTFFKRKPNRVRIRRVLICIEDLLSIINKSL
jgi:hypothetical protein